MADENANGQAETLPRVDGSILAESVPVALVEKPAIEPPINPDGAVTINRIEPLREQTGAPEPPQTRSPLCCPECGQGPWETEKALSAHVRFKHELPKARKLAAERKARVANGEPEPIPPPDFTDIDQSAPKPPEPVLVTSDARFEAMASMSFEMTTGLLARLLGPEWQSKDADERATVILAIKKYYASVNLPDIPPGYMLCFVCLAYAAPRLGAQPTKTKLQGAWLWLKSKFGRKQKALMHIVSPPTEKIL